MKYSVYDLPTYILLFSKSIKKNNHLISPTFFFTQLAPLTCTVQVHTILISPHFIDDINDNKVTITITILYSPNQ